MSGDAPRGTAEAARGARPGRPGPPAARQGLLAALVAVLIILPGLGLPRLTVNLGATIVLFGLAATGLNLMLGYAGMLSLGGALYLGASGYIAALTTQLWGWPELAALFAAIAGSLLLAVVLGFVLVGLSGHYFAVANLGLATALAALLVAFPQVTGGTSGLTTARTLDLGVVTVGSDLGWYAVALIAAATGLLVFNWTVAGKRGRILRLVRADELAANVLGVRTFRTKLLVYVIAAFFPALAGALLFPFSGLVTPDAAGAVQSVQLVALIVVGGVGYRLGGFAGALVILWLQALVDTSGNWSLLIYAIVFLLVMFYAPAGVIGVLRQGRGRLVGPRPPGAGAGAPPAPATGRPAAAGRAPGARAAAGPGQEGLVVRGVSKSFGGVAAVRDVSLVVRPGTIVALVGSNGAGKSTLVNVISGIEPPDKGAVLLHGRDLTPMRAPERTRMGIARTFQVPRLVDELTVADNLVLGEEAAEGSFLRRSRVREARSRERALARLAEGALSGLAGRRAGSLGTGERKYVELVRALTADPAVCLLDEPAVGLSLDEIARLGSWILALRDRGAAVLVIDHNLDFIRRLADMVYVMDLGRVIRTGTADELAGTRDARASLLSGEDGGTAADGGAAGDGGRHGESG